MLELISNINLVIEKMDNDNYDEEPVTKWFIQRITNGYKYLMVNKSLMNIHTYLSIKFTLTFFFDKRLFWELWSNWSLLLNGIEVNKR